jgi:AraC-like DNA-binding protein
MRPRLHSAVGPGIVGLRHRPRRVGIRFYPPCQELSDVVARIYVHDNDPSTRDDPRWLIVPDGDIKLIFPIAGAIRCRVGAAERLHRPQCLIVSGMRTEPGHLSFPHGVNAIGVIVRPEAAYRLIPHPHVEIVNLTLDGEDIFGRQARRLCDELMDLPGERDRLAHLQSTLLEWLRRGDDRDRQFEYVVRRLRQHAGRVPVEVLARDANLSRRQLERRFGERAGIGPKRLADILRFHVAYKRIRGSGGGGYASLVQDLYFDQSHFLKAFRRYTGLTPRIYWRTRDYGRLYIPERGQEGWNVAGDAL